MTAVPQLIGEIDLAKQSVFLGNLTFFEARPVSVSLETAGY
jgi:hypothetical protein